MRLEAAMGGRIHAGMANAVKESYSPKETNPIWQSYLIVQLSLHNESLQTLVETQRGLNILASYEAEDVKSNQVGRNNFNKLKAVMLSQLSLPKLLKTKNRGRQAFTTHEALGMAFGQLKAVDDGLFKYLARIGENVFIRQANAADLL
nr:uncharacterized protein CTRU02_01132 [Colletotrichum truncatum]KAF6800727.1 hypothetical protein CTRU02_01132 [Colletotrichum truncatum]